jgi:hypothetical protein
MKSTNAIGRCTERGAAIVVMTVTVLVAVTIATSLLVVASSRNKATTSRIGMEKALAAAEAGLARGQAEANLTANRSNPAWPPLGPGIVLTGTSAELRDASTITSVVGRFVVTLQSGLSDLKDNNGNGLTDEGATPPPPAPVPADPANQGEGIYVIVTSVGYSGPVSDSNPYKVRVKGIIKINRNPFGVSGALAVNGANPDFSIASSNSFKVSGFDHDDDSNAVVNPPTAANPGMPAVAVVAPTLNATDTASIVGNPNVVGPMQLQLGVPPNPIADLVAFAKENANFTTPNKLPDSFDYGSIIYHEGNQNVTGNAYGAGIWVVNGDLEYAGTCQFKGVMIVTGKLTIKGGGNDYLIRGAAIVGGSAAIDFDNNGTTDIRYSSEAVTKAMNSMAYFSQVGWQQLTTN